jgi:hypothetical protein
MLFKAKKQRLGDAHFVKSRADVQVFPGFLDKGSKNGSELRERIGRPWTFGLTRGLPACESIMTIFR